MDVVPVAARRVAWRRLIAGLTLTFAWARPLAGAEVTRLPRQTVRGGENSEVSPLLVI